MIVYKVKKVQGVYLHKFDKDNNGHAYDLHVLKFGSLIRVFLEGQVIAYEVTESEIVVSDIIGLLSFLSSKNKTGKWYHSSGVEFIKPRWFHALPRVSVERR